MTPPASDTAAAPGCPFRPSAAASTSQRAGPEYRRPLRFLHNPRVRADIAGLDAQADCQRIVHLLTAYEFPFDMTRALEIALFHTYGSRSVSRLLDRTGQFARQGQKRYDDTNLLIAQFMEAGWDAELGARALARMNHIHSHFKIPNEDFLFVLWTFIDFPIQWITDFGWRRLTEHECLAWFNYWTGIGQRMGLQNLPASKTDYDALVLGYEAREFVPDAASTRVADATVAIMQGWLPRPLRWAVKPVAACLVRPQFLHATGYALPNAGFRALVRGVLKLRARVKSLVSIERYPTLLGSKPYRSYPDGRPAIEATGPDGLRPRG